MGHGKSITVYLMDGDANQRYQVTLDNWNIVAFKIPYEMVSQSSNLNDLSLHTAGIYFLFGYQGSKNFVYVGEAEDKCSIVHEIQKVHFSLTIVKEKHTF